MAVAEAALAIALIAGKDAHEHQIHHDAQARHPEHDHAVDFRGVEQPLDGLVDEDTCHDPDDHDGDEGTEHLDAMVAKGVLGVRHAVREEERHHAHEEPEHGTEGPDQVRHV